MQRFVQNKETLNLGTKTPYLGLFRLKLEKTIFLVAIRTFKFVKIKKFVQN